MPELFWGQKGPNSCSSWKICRSLWCVLCVFMCEGRGNEGGGGLILTLRAGHQPPPEREGMV